MCNLKKEGDYVFEFFENPEIEEIERYGYLKTYEERKAVYYCVECGDRILEEDWFYPEDHGAVCERCKKSTRKVARVKEIQLEGEDFDR